MPGWPTDLSSSTNSLFPSNTSEPLSSDNQVVVDYTPAGGVTDPNYVFGGLSQEGVTNNSVEIRDGRVNVEVFGGFSYGSGSTNASGNRVTISGGTVHGDIYGGYGYSSNAAYNTISGSPVLTTSYIRGGDSGSGGGDAFTGNTLNVKSSNISAAGVGNFEYYNFYLPDGTAANDNMFLISDTNDLDLTGAKAEVSPQGKTTLQAGDRVSLINSAAEVINYSSSTSQALQGVLLTYDFDIYAETNDLWAELTSVKTSPGSKAMTNSRTAPLAFLSQGADLAASLEYLEVSTDRRFTTFAVADGGSSTYDTGSDVDVKGVSVLAGVAWGSRSGGNYLSMRAFIEAGWGSYDTDNSYGGTSVKGGGDM